MEDTPEYTADVRRKPTISKDAQTARELDTYRLSTGGVFDVNSSALQYDSMPAYQQHENVMMQQNYMADITRTKPYTGESGFWNTIGAEADSGWLKYASPIRLWLDGDDDNKPYMLDKQTKELDMAGLAPMYQKWVEERAQNKRTYEVALTVARRWQENDQVGEHTGIAGRLAGSLIGGLITPEGMVGLGLGILTGGTSYAATGAAMLGRAGLVSAGRTAAAETAIATVGSMAVGAATNVAITAPTAGLTPYDDDTEIMMSAIFGAGFGGLGGAIGHSLKLRARRTDFEGKPVDPTGAPAEGGPVDGGIAPKPKGTIDTKAAAPDVDDPMAYRPRSTYGTADGTADHVTPTGSFDSAASRIPGAVGRVAQVTDGTPVRPTVIADMLKDVTNGDARALGLKRVVMDVGALGEGNGVNAGRMVGELVDDGVDPSVAATRAALAGEEAYVDPTQFYRFGNKTVGIVGDDFGSYGRDALRRAGIDAVDNRHPALDMAYRANVTRKMTAAATAAAKTADVEAPGSVVAKVADDATPDEIRMSEFWARMQDQSAAWYRRGGRTREQMEDDFQAVLARERKATEDAGAAIREKAAGAATAESHLARDDWGTLYDKRTGEVVEDVKPHERSGPIEDVTPGEVAEVDLDHSPAGRAARDVEEGKTEAEALSERDLDGNPMVETDVPADRAPGASPTIQDFLTKPMRLGLGHDTEGWHAAHRAAIAKQEALGADAIPGKPAPEGARVTPTDEAKMPANKRTAELMRESDSEYVPLARNFAGSTKLSVGQALSGSVNPLTRKLFSKLGTSVMGYEGNWTAPLGTALTKVRAERLKMQQWFNATQESGFTAYAKEQGLWAGRFRPEVQKAYSLELNDVFRGRRPRGESPALDAAADALHERFGTYLQRFADSGEEWATRELARYAANPELRYAPRQWDLQAVQRLVDMHGMDEVGRNFGKALALGHAASGAADGIPPAAYANVGKAYIRTLVRAQRDFDQTGSLGKDAIGAMRKDLEEAGLDDLRIRDMIDEVQNAPTQVGMPGFLKRRAPMDEQMVMDLADVNGKPFSIGDVMNNDMLAVSLSYMNRAEGELALRSVGFTKGLRSAMDDVKASTVDAVGHVEGYGAKLANKEKLDLEYLVKHVAGVPRVADPNSTAWRLSRIVRQLGFSQLMGGLGLAQIGESGMILAHNGVAATLRQLPALKELARYPMTLAGKEMSAFSEEMRVLGVGVQRDGHRIMPLYQDVDRLIETGRLNPATDSARFGVKDKGAGLGSKLLTGAEETTKRLANFTATASGGNAMTDMLRLYAARASVQNLVDSVKKGGMAASRMDFEAGMGMDAKLYAKLAPLLERHVELDGTGGVVKLNLERIRWDDEAAGAALSDYIVKRANRTIMDPDPAMLPRVFGTSPLVAVMAHLKTFSIAGHTAHLYNGMATGRNMQGVLLPAVLYGGLLATLQTHARVAIQTAGLSDAERKQVYAQRFGTNATHTNTVMNAMATVGMIPQTMATVAQLMGVDDEMFAYNRQSGLTGSFLNGIPAVAQATNAGLTSVVTGDQPKGFASIYGRNADDLKANDGLMPSGKEIKQLRTLLPWQNTLGVQQGLNYLMAKTDHAEATNLDQEPSALGALYGGNPTPAAEEETARPEEPFGALQSQSQNQMDNPFQ